MNAEKMFKAKIETQNSSFNFGSTDKTSVPQAYSGVLRILFGDRWSGFSPERFSQPERR
jgi:hypothetical protein